MRSTKNLPAVNLREKRQGGETNQEQPKNLDAAKLVGVVEHDA